jgi:hypothetical protein
MNEIDTDTEVNNKAPLDYENIIDKEEYEVLFNWNSEWVRICRLLAVFSFSSIGFTMLIFDIKSDNSIPENQILLIKQSWSLLGAGGLLSGLSIGLAYYWLDCFSRGWKPSLIGKVVYSQRYLRGLKIGAIGWVITVIAAISTLTGLYYFIKAARMVL